jgi:chitinase
MFATLQSQFDQMNLMTYDLAGPYAGWVTWFNSPILDGGYRFPSTGGLVPSLEGAVTNFLANGLAAAKLGIGVAFYGDVWAGGTGTSTGGAALPRQSWTSPPTVTQMAYYGIMSTYYQTNLYRWDSAAQAAYLSIDNPGSANDKFISYDDEHTCQAKVTYARTRGLGGLMIWELGQGYWATQPAGQRNPLLQAIKQSLAMPAIAQFGTNVVLSWPLGTLQQSDMVPGSWSDLLDATSPFTNPTSGPSKFFRVKLP